jgi:hypothetical protein
MVKYLKTKRGYFYKIKNGKKKRISRKKFSEKNKTRKTKKMIGGGKTEKEILEELDKKYMRSLWEIKGKWFGLQYGPPETRSLVYKDVNNEYIKVNGITQTFDTRVHVDNVAVFPEETPEERPAHHIDVSDPGYVDGGKFKIVDSPNILFTGGLSNCTALAIKIGTTKLMAHIETDTNIELITKAIVELIKRNEAHTLTAFIFKGVIGADKTLQKAQYICRLCGIEKVYESEVDTIWKTVSI